MTKKDAKRWIKIVKTAIWIVLSGLWLALLWGTVGVLLCVTVIGIPFGIQCFRIAKLAFLPHDKQVVLRFREHRLANTIWIIFGGWEMALFHLIFGITGCLTIIGIGKGLQSFKIMKVALVPFGTVIK